MIDFLVLIAVTVLLSHVIENRTYQFETTQQGIHHDGQSKLIYLIIIIALILFAGLRTSYNDTRTYMLGFRMLDDSSIHFKDIFSPYGGFDFYQKLIKSYIGTNPQWLIFISAIITTLLYVVYIAGHSEYFSESMMLYMTASYAFCLAGIKQGLAIGISLYAIDAYLERRYVKAIILLLLAMSFHPYIVCLLCIPFLKKRIWDIRTMLIIFIAVVAFMNMDKLFSIISAFGKDYSMEAWDDYTINPMRVLVQSVPVVISFAYKKKINESQDELLILGTNMRIISFIFLAMGLLVNPIYLGRMSSYFSALSLVTIPKMLRICFGSKYKEQFIILGYYAFFFAYFLLDMTKLGSISVFTDQFNHISLFGLFAENVG